MKHLLEDEEVKNVLRENDTNVNVNWPLAHYKSAVRYLARDASDIAATGGTNWQKYLPPRFQKRIFYLKIRLLWKSKPPVRISDSVTGVDAPLRAMKSAISI